MQFLREFIPKSIDCLRNYSFQIFKKDLAAGVTVGIIALPLAMAFAIASGVRPDQGLYTAIIAGFLMSFFGGSRVQIGGPTGAFVVVIYDIVQRQGYEGLVLATVVASVLLVIMGLCRLGTLIKYIPYPLITGFTSGIAVIIFSAQIKDFFGLRIENIPADFLEKWQAIFKALPTFDGTTLLLSGGCVLFIVLIRRFLPSIPWGIAAIALATFFCWAFHLPIETVGSRFGQVPRMLPAPSFPSLALDFESLKNILPDAITIAFLAGIESLLSAVIADRMIQSTHKSNCELIAQGIGNFGSILFGGIPATAGIARTAANIKTGARTPVAGMIHAAVVFLFILVLAPVAALIPLPALAAVLIVVAWNMSEVMHFRRLFRAPVGDVAVLLSTFLLTVLVDITVAVEMGMVLAAFLFLRRMSKTSPIISPFHPEKEMPQGVSFYEIHGPFFFGVADHLKQVQAQLGSSEKVPSVCILRMKKVSMLDATGMHALREFYYQCKEKNTTLVLVELRQQPGKLIRKFGLEELIGEQNMTPHIDAALQRAHEITNTKI